MAELNLIKATDLPASKVMEFRQAFLSAGECSINGSRGLHNYEKYGGEREKDVPFELENEQYYKYWIVL